MDESILEQFLEQYQPLHFLSADPEGRQEQAFVKFVDGKMTRTECQDVMQQYYSDKYDDQQECN